MNFSFFTKLFSKPKVKVVDVVVSSKDPKASQPWVTVLTLDSEWAKNEWDEGFLDGKIDAGTGKPMCSTLNYPVAPYARGYFEGYRSIKKD